jgi:hypothetical protein
MTKRSIARPYSFLPSEGFALKVPLLLTILLLINVMGCDFIGQGGTKRPDAVVDQGKLIEWKALTSDAPDGQAEFFGPIPTFAKDNTLAVITEQEGQLFHLGSGHLSTIMTIPPGLGPEPAPLEIDENGLKTIASTRQAFGMPMGDAGVIDAAGKIVFRLGPGPDSRAAEMEVYDVDSDGVPEIFASSTGGLRRLTPAGEVVWLHPHYLLQNVAIATLPNDDRKLIYVNGKEKVINAPWEMFWFDTSGVLVKRVEIPIQYFSVITVPGPAGSVYVIPQHDEGTTLTFIDSDNTTLFTVSESAGVSMERQVLLLSAVQLRLRPGEEIVYGITIRDLEQRGSTLIILDKSGTIMYEKNWDRSAKLTVIRGDNEHADTLYLHDGAGTIYQGKI